MPMMEMHVLAEVSEGDEGWDERRARIDGILAQAVPKGVPDACRCVRVCWEGGPPTHQYVTHLPTASPPQRSSAFGGSPP